MLARANTIRELEKLVAQKKKEGWQPVSEIKLDDSEMAYSKFTYVQVLELPENSKHNPTNKKHKWGRF